MTTLQGRSPVGVELDPDLESQEARWAAWRAKGVAADLVTDRRMRLAFVVTMVLVCLAFVVLV
jgi:hypothetical protein